MLLACKAYYDETAYLICAVAPDTIEFQRRGLQFVDEFSLFGVGQTGRVSFSLTTSDCRNLGGSGDRDEVLVKYFNIQRHTAHMLESRK